MKTVLHVFARVTGFAIIVITSVPLCIIVVVDAVNPYNVHRRMCPDGQFYTLQSNGSSACNNCTVCPRGQQASTTCTETNNSVCSECPTGTFNTVRGGQCRACTVCKPGQYRSRYCRSKRNAVCNTCPNRTYSTKEDAGACRYCTVCLKQEFVSMECTNKSDTRCTECKEDYFLNVRDGKCTQCSPCIGLNAKERQICQTEYGPYEKTTCWPSPTNTLDNVTDNGSTNDDKQGLNSTIMVIIIVFVCIAIVGISLIIIVSLKRKAMQRQSNMLRHERGNHQRQCSTTDSMEPLFVHRVNVDEARPSPIFYRPCSAKSANENNLLLFDGLYEYNTRFTPVCSNKDKHAPDEMELELTTTRSHVPLIDTPRGKESEFTVKVNSHTTHSNSSRTSWHNNSNSSRAAWQNDSNHSSRASWQNERNAYDVGSKRSTF